MSDEIKKEILNPEIKPKEKTKEELAERSQRINDNFCATAFKFLVAINESAIIINDQNKQINRHYKEINKSLVEKIQHMQATRDINADNSVEDEEILGLMDTYLKGLTIDREAKAQIINIVGE